MAEITSLSGEAWAAGHWTLGLARLLAIVFSIIRKNCFNLHFWGNWIIRLRHGESISFSKLIQFDSNMTYLRFEDSHAADTNHCKTVSGDTIWTHLPGPRLASTDTDFHLTGQAIVTRQHRVKVSIFPPLTIFAFIVS